MLDGLMADWNSQEVYYQRRGDGQYKAYIPFLNKQYRLAIDETSISEHDLDRKFWAGSSFGHQLVWQNTSPGAPDVESATAVGMITDVYYSPGSGLPHMLDIWHYSGTWVHNATVYNTGSDGLTFSVIDDNIGGVIKDKRHYVGLTNMYRLEGGVWIEDTEFKWTYQEGHMENEAVYVYEGFDGTLYDEYPSNCKWRGKIEGPHYGAGNNGQLYWRPQYQDGGWTTLFIGEVNPYFYSNQTFDNTGGQLVLDVGDKVKTIVDGVTHIATVAKLADVGKLRVWNTTTNSVDPDKSAIVEGCAYWANPQVRSGKHYHFSFNTEGYPEDKRQIAAKRPQPSRTPYIDYTESYDYITQFTYVNPHTNRSYDVDYTGRPYISNPNKTRITSSDIEPGYKWGLPELGTGAVITWSITEGDQDVWGYMFGDDQLRRYQQLYSYRNYVK